MKSAISGQGRQRTVQFILLLAFAVGSAFFYPRHSLTHDASWYLVATAMFLEGGELYADIYEINPPLAFYLTAPAVILANKLDLNATDAYFLYCISLSVVSALWCGRLLRSSGEYPPNSLALFITVLLILFILPVAEFGQREHLLLIFALPYLLYLSVRDSAQQTTRFEAIALGIFAFLGLALKPYFLAIPALLMLVVAFRERSLKPFLAWPNWVVAALLVAYVLFIIAVHPLYLQDVVPKARLVYDSYGVDPLAVWLRLEIAAFAVLSVFVLLRRRAVTTRTLALWAAAAGALLSYLLQFKGWDYHILPASAFILLCCASAVKDLGKQFGRITLFAIISLCLVTTLGRQLQRGAYQSATTEVFASYVTQENTPILVLSTNVWAAFPFVNEVNGVWTSRYPAQWLVPGAVTRLASEECHLETPTCTKTREVLDFARDTMVADFLRNQPELVFVDERSRKSYFGNVAFAYIPFLKSDAAFLSAWRCYEKVGDVRSYSVWRRRCER
ncbi:hypothetical protein GRI38_13190 [Altererythrobacter aurantiacus]|uniref:Glycosyltransferase RgtA/B/C/D-like domain-containing protein n=1 Tax=Parapontixanthobacter aurantiacus TaxID=1463599 RepID=A0A844ZI99_9SPHN|nr:hypothetical protein [Parapontixanthobacter aurantiacus]MXO86982.1 hypothetical protein [Parapontixanthobacter aurantiacus]